MAPSVTVPILYIGGSSRSGSTVLAHLLGRYLGGVVVGELKDIWRNGVLGNQLCGCGRPFLSCDFWDQVGAEAFGGWNALPLKSLAALQQRIDRLRNYPRLLIPWVTRRRDPRFAAELDWYIGILLRLYRAVQHVSGCSLVVDASKHPAQPLLLARSPHFDLHVVHLVRDSRGVAWSSAKRVVRPEVANSMALMRRWSLNETVWNWTIINLRLHLLIVHRIPRLLVRYELYTKAPSPTLRRIAAFLDSSSHTPFGDSSQVELKFSADHSLGGNPVRFAVGSVRLHSDEEWRTAMRRSAQLYIGALTFPLLALYNARPDP